MAVPVFMTITGYVQAITATKHQKRFSDNYQPKILAAKWIRYTVPFIPAWILGVIARIIGKGVRFNVGELIVDFLIGGVGPGSYYYPVMVQIIFIMPIIIWIVNRFKEKGLIAIFAFNVLFEIIQHELHMTSYVYRLCSLRYVFVIAYGCYLFVKGRSIRIFPRYIVAGIVGFLYIIFFKIIDLTPLFTNNDWKGTSVFAVLFIAPVMVLLIDKTWIKIGLFERLGRASYEIFLVQMIYFLAGGDIIQKFVPSTITRIIINILICCSVGYIYYAFEYPLLQKLVHRIKSV